MDVPFPETPTLVDARIVESPAGGRDCLVAKTEEGRWIAFGFEVESDRPGLEIVDARLWLEAAGEPEDSPAVFDAVREPNADDWLQTVVTNPVGHEWLERIKAEHPRAYASWFAQSGYDEGGEEGSGGAV